MTDKTTSKKLQTENDSMLMMYAPMPNEHNISSNMMIENASVPG
jgi:hypothetical protein